MMFHHLDRLKAMFGTRAADRIAIMGHSRGGEAVVQAVSMSLNPTIDHNIEAVISLAPTDQYGRPPLGESATRPYLEALSFEDRQVVVQCLLSRAVVTGEQVDIYYALPFVGLP